MQKRLWYSPKSNGSPRCGCWVLWPKKGNILSFGFRRRSLAECPVGNPTNDVSLVVIKNTAAFLPRFLMLVIAKNLGPVVPPVPGHASSSLKQIDRRPMHRNFKLAFIANRRKIGVIHVVFKVIQVHLTLRRI